MRNSSGESATYLLLSLSYLRPRSSSSDYLHPFCLFRSYLSLVLPFVQQWYEHVRLSWRTTHIDSHHEIYEHRPRVSGCKLCWGWNILLEVTGTEKVPVKLPRLFSSCVKIPLEFLRDLIEEPKNPSSAFRSFLVRQLYRNRFTGHIIARQIFRLLGLPLPLLLSTQLSFSYYLFSSTLSRPSHVHALFFSRWFHLHTYNFFFGAFCIQKDIFWFVSFFLLGNPETQAPVTQTQDTALLTSGELFFIYTWLLRSSLRILMTIRTQETCVSLVFFLFRFLFSESLHLYTSSSNPFLVLLHSSSFEKLIGVTNVQSKVRYKQLRPKALRYLLHFPLSPDNNAERI